jgi:type I restriction enzyme S subunit
MSKAIPKLRFKEFSGRWELKRLSQLLEFKNGINASKEQYGRGFKFINVLDILNNEFITHDSIIGSVDVDKNAFEKYPVNYGDILFQRSSETREEVGTACVYLDSRPATFGGFVIRGRKIGEYDPMFLNKLLKTDLSRNEITSKSGGSTRYNVGQETLSSVALPFPTLPEQQKIASFLSAVDEKIQQLTRKKELLEQYKKGVMQQLFSSSELGFAGLEDDRIDADDKNNPTILKSKKSKFRQLRFKDENGKAYPKWEEKRLGDVLEIGSGRDYKHLSVGDIPVYGTGGLMTMVNEFLHDGETVCIGRKGTIDKPMYYNGKIWTVDTLFFTYAFKNSIPKFIFFLFQQINWKLYNEASGVPSLSKATIEKLKFEFPCKEEQQKIANFLSAIDTKIESVATQIEKTQTFKKGLLQQMFV